MKRVILLAALGLAGCSFPPQPFAQSQYGIEIAASGSQRQQAEDMAVAHCAKSGLVPRLTGSGETMATTNGLAMLPTWRYECITKPK